MKIKNRLKTDETGNIDAENALNFKLSLEQYTNERKQQIIAIDMLAK